MRQYEKIQDIKTRLPGEKGYILITPGGSSFILGQDDIEPTQRVCLLGILER